MGYPGEGWTPLRIATWNTRSLTFERFKYCEGLGYDILAITELWRKQQNYQTRSTKYTTSAPKKIMKGPRRGRQRFPQDKAAGVGILLSTRMQKKLMRYGSEGERVCWVRLKGPTCNIFIVAVYMPHRGRTQPNQDDTIKDLQLVLSKIPSGDCICVLGDLNEQLEGNVLNRTGKWTAGPKSKNADKMLDIMHMYNLTAANTLFEPKNEFALYTFLQTEKKETSVKGDMGEYVGRKVNTNIDGNWTTGTVRSTSSKGEEQEWLVVNADGSTHHFRRDQIETSLVRPTRKKTGKQLDYILVSTRWKSCIKNCRTRWGPSIHRDLHGEKNDHALVECIWNWRIHTEKPRPRRDFACLYTQERDRRGQPKKTGCMIKFEEVVEGKLSELGYNAIKDSTTEMYEKMCVAIHTAMHTILPSRRRRSSAVRRRVSERTKNLFKQRTALRKKGTEAQFAQIQKEIRSSSLADYTAWVQEWANVIGRRKHR